MLFGQRKIFINYYYRVYIDCIFFSDSAIIYFCQSCVTKNIAYNINFNISEKYVECVCYRYIYKLIFNINKFDRILREQKKLYNQFLVSETKNIRLRKLLRANRKKLRKFNSYENRNIKKFEKLERELEK